MIFLWFVNRHGLPESLSWDVPSCINFLTSWRMPSSGMWHRLSLQPPAHAGSSFADFSTLKIEAIRSSETSVHTRSHGATSQKTALLIVTAVKTSNLPYKLINNLYCSSFYWKLFRLMADGPQVYFQLRFLLLPPSIIERAETFRCEINLPWGSCFGTVLMKLD
jgi:hypothetical protein